MPTSTSAFEWWGWLLIAVAFAVAMAILEAIARVLKENDVPLLAFFFSAPAVVAGIGCLGSFALAIIRFAKWAWGG